MQLFWGDIVATIILASLVFLSIENPPLLIDDFFHKKRLEKRKLKEAKA